MGAIFETFQEIFAEHQAMLPPYVVITDDQVVEPVKAIYLDYTPVNVLRMGWVNERGTGGKSRKAVVHARCDRAIGKRQKGELLCGYKSRAKWGGDLYSVDEQVDCPQCQKLAVGLSQSMLRSPGWFY